jgi:hypothetical protein
MITATTTQSERYTDAIDTYEPNAETLQAFKDVEERRNLTGPFKSVEDMMASLLSDDDA